MVRRSEKRVSQSTWRRLGPNRYRYDLSKRTGLTLAWTRMDNDSNSNSVSARLGTAASVLKPGDSQDAYGLIMKLKF